MAFLPEKQKWETVDVMIKHVDEHPTFKLLRIIPKRFRDTIVEHLIRRSLSEYVDRCFLAGVDTGDPSTVAAYKKSCDATKLTS